MLGISPLTTIGFGSGLFSFFRQGNTRWGEILSPLKSTGVLPLTSFGPSFHSSSIIRIQSVLSGSNLQVLKHKTCNAIQNTAHIMALQYYRVSKGCEVVKRKMAMEHEAAVLCAVSYLPILIHTAKCEIEILWQIKYQESYF